MGFPESQTSVFYYRHEAMRIHCSEFWLVHPPKGTACRDVLVLNAEFTD